MPLAHTPLLPGAATPWERMMAEARDPLARLGADYDSIRAATQVPPPPFLPFIVWQRGLGELSPYLPNLYDLIAEGTKWQRERGTPAAIARGLGWLGYAGTLEEAPWWRRLWNRYQIHLDRVRAADLPDLARIAGIVQLSDPERSRFKRAYHGYDVRACETSRQRTGESMTSDTSGVRIEGISPLWSFGRLYEREHQLSEAELTALGTWIAPVPEGELWVDADYFWVDADFAWHTPAAQARRDAIASAITAMPVWLRFRAADDSIIGHARAVSHPVATAGSEGEYPFGPGRLGVSDAPTGVLVQATSGFGDGASAVAASASLLFDAVPADPARPGALWLAAEGLTGGVEVCNVPMAITFGLTVRERARILLRF